MRNNTNLLLVESEMVKAKGHFLDYLIETSNYFKNNKKIIVFKQWFRFTKLFYLNFVILEKLLFQINLKEKKINFYILLRKYFFLY